MQKDINLTTCLRFDSTEERDAVQVTDKRSRDAKLPTVAESLLNILLACRRLQRSTPEVGGAFGHVDLDGTIYEVHVRLSSPDENDKPVSTNPEG